MLSKRGKRLREGGDDVFSLCWFLTSPQEESMVLQKSVNIVIFPGGEHRCISKNGIIAYNNIIKRIVN